jgi:hypothetical protein
MMGVVSLISSIPFFFIKQPFVIFHAAYSGHGTRLPATTEVFDSETGIFYGIWFAAIGCFLIYLYIRIKRDSQGDCPHGHKGRH